MLLLLLVLPKPNLSLFLLSIFKFPSSLFPKSNSKLSTCSSVLVPYIPFLCFDVNIVFPYFFLLLYSLLLSFPKPYQNSPSAFVPSPSFHTPPLPIPFLNLGLAICYFMLFYLYIFIHLLHGKEEFRGSIHFTYFLDYSSIDQVKKYFRTY